MAKTVRTIDGSNEEILAQLKTIEESDKKAESHQKTGCLVALLGVLGIFSPAILHTELPKWLAVPMLAVIAVGLVIYARGNAGDVDDARYHALRRLHRFLSGDGDKDTRYHYVLDLRPYTHRAFYCRTDKFGGMFSLPRGKIEFYDCPVLYAQVQLRDGTLLSASANRLTRRRTRTKRGYSGKTKTKIAEKYSTRYALKARFPDGPDIKLAPRPPETTGGRLKALLKSQKARGNKIAATSIQKTSYQPLEVDGLLQLMIQTFHQVNLARRPAT